ncbi:MAG: hypothetical protein IPP74_00600 [Alphaproteobacteria bacterium]|nr:hypothetical protein [Alphaproteobacteria bacterium]
MIEYTVLQELVESHEGIKVIYAFSDPAHYASSSMAALCDSLFIRVIYVIIAWCCHLAGDGAAHGALPCQLQ